MKLSPLKKIQVLNYSSLHQITRNAGSLPSNTVNHPGVTCIPKIKLLNRSTSSSRPGIRTSSYGLMSRCRSRSLPTRLSNHVKSAATSSAPLIDGVNYSTADMTAANASSTANATTEQTKVKVENSVPDISKKIDKQNEQMENKYRDFKEPTEEAIGLPYYFKKVCVKDKNGDISYALQKQVLLFPGSTIKKPAANLLHQPALQTKRSESTKSIPTKPKKEHSSNIDKNQYLKESNNQIAGNQKTAQNEESFWFFYDEIPEDQKNNFVKVKELPDNEGLQWVMREKIRVINNEDDLILFDENHQQDEVKKKILQEVEHINSQELINSFGIAEDILNEANFPKRTKKSKNLKEVLSSKPEVKEELEDPEMEHEEVERQLKRSVSATTLANCGKYLIEKYYPKRDQLNPIVSERTELESQMMEFKNFCDKLFKSARAELESLKKLSKSQLNVSISNTDIKKTATMKIFPRKSASTGCFTVPNKLSYSTIRNMVSKSFHNLFKTTPKVVKKVSKCTIRQRSKVANKEPSLQKKNLYLQKLDYIVKRLEESQKDLYRSAALIRLKREDFYQNTLPKDLPKEISIHEITTKFDKMQEELRCNMKEIDQLKTKIKHIESNIRQDHPYANLIDNSKKKEKDDRLEGYKKEFQERAKNNKIRNSIPEKATIIGNTVSAMEKSTEEIFCTETYQKVLMERAKGFQTVKIPFPEKRGLNITKCTDNSCVEAYRRGLQERAKSFQTIRNSLPEKEDNISLETYLTRLQERTMGFKTVKISSSDKEDLPDITVEGLDKSTGGNRYLEAYRKYLQERAKSFQTVKNSPEMKVITGNASGPINKGPEEKVYLTEDYRKGLRERAKSFQTIKISLSEREELPASSLGSTKKVSEEKSHLETYRKDLQERAKSFQTIRNLLPEEESSITGNVLRTNFLINKFPEGLPEQANSFQTINATFPDNIGYSLEAINKGAGNNPNPEVYQKGLQERAKSFQNIKKSSETENILDEVVRATIKCAEESLHMETNQKGFQERARSAPSYPKDEDTNLRATNKFFEENMSLEAYIGFGETKKPKIKISHSTFPEQEGSTILGNALEAINKCAEKLRGRKDPSNRRIRSSTSPEKEGTTIICNALGAINKCAEENLFKKMENIMSHGQLISTSSTNKAPDIPPEDPTKRDPIKKNEDHLPPHLRDEPDEPEAFEEKFPELEPEPSKVTNVRPIMNEQKENLVRTLSNSMLSEHFKETGNEYTFKKYLSIPEGSFCRKSKQVLKPPEAPKWNKPLPGEGWIGKKDCKSVMKPPVLPKWNHNEGVSIEKKNVSIVDPIPAEKVEVIMKENLPEKTLVLEKIPLPDETLGNKPVFNVKPVIGKIVPEQKKVTLKINPSKLKAINGIKSRLQPKLEEFGQMAHKDQPEPKMMHTKQATATESTAVIRPISKESQIETGEVKKLPTGVLTQMRKLNKVDLQVEYVDAYEGMDLEMPKPEPKKSMDVYDQYVDVSTTCQVLDSLSTDLSYIHKLENTEKIPQKIVEPSLIDSIDPKKPVGKSKNSGPMDIDHSKYRVLSFQQQIVHTPKQNRRSRHVTYAAESLEEPPKVEPSKIKILRSSIQKNQPEIIVEIKAEEYLKDGLNTMSHVKEKPQNPKINLNLDLNLEQAQKFMFRSKKDPNLEPVSKLKINLEKNLKEKVGTNYSNNSKSLEGHVPNPEANIIVKTLPEQSKQLKYSKSLEEPPKHLKVSKFMEEKSSRSLKDTHTHLKFSNQLEEPQKTLKFSKNLEEPPKNVRCSKILEAEPSMSLKCSKILEEEPSIHLKFSRKLKEPPKHLRVDNNLVEPPKQHLNQNLKKEHVSKLVSNERNLEEPIRHIKFSKNLQEYPKQLKVNNRNLQESPKLLLNLVNDPAFEWELDEKNLNVTPTHLQFSRNLEEPPNHLRLSRNWEESPKKDQQVLESKTMEEEDFQKEMENLDKMEPLPKSSKLSKEQPLDNLRSKLRQLKEKLKLSKAKWDQPQSEQLKLIRELSEANPDLSKQNPKQPKSKVDQPLILKTNLEPPQNLKEPQIPKKNISPDHISKSSTSGTIPQSSPEGETTSISGETSNPITKSETEEPIEEIITINIPTQEPKADSKKEEPVPNPKKNLEPKIEETPTAKVIEPKVPKKAPEAKIEDVEPKITDIPSKKVPEQIKDVPESKIPEPSVKDVPKHVPEGVKDVPKTKRTPEPKITNIPRKVPGFQKVNVPKAKIPEPVKDAPKPKVPEKGIKDVPKVPESRKEVPKGKVPEPTREAPEKKVPEHNVPEKVPEQNIQESSEKTKTDVVPEQIVDVPEAKVPEEQNIQDNPKTKVPEQDVPKPKIPQEAPKNISEKREPKHKVRDVPMYKITDEEVPEKVPQGKIPELIIPGRPRPKVPEPKIRDIPKNKMVFPEKVPKPAEQKREVPEKIEKGTRIQIHITPPPPELKIPIPEKNIKEVPKEESLPSQQVPQAKVPEPEPEPEKIKETPKAKIEPKIHDGPKTKILDLNIGDIPEPQIQKSEIPKRVPKVPKDQETAKPVPAPEITKRVPQKAPEIPKAEVPKPEVSQPKAEVPERVPKPEANIPESEVPQPKKEVPQVPESSKRIEEKPKAIKDMPYIIPPKTSRSPKKFSGIEKVPGIDQSKNIPKVTSAKVIKETVKKDRFGTDFPRTTPSGRNLSTNFPEKTFNFGFDKKSYSDFPYDFQDLLDVPQKKKNNQKDSFETTTILKPVPEDVNDKIRVLLSKPGHVLSPNIYQQIRRKPNSRKIVIKFSDNEQKLSIYSNPDRIKSVNQDLKHFLENDYRASDSPYADSIVFPISRRPFSQLAIERRKALFRRVPLQAKRNTCNIKVPGKTWPFPVERKETVPKFRRVTFICKRKSCIWVPKKLPIKTQGENLPFHKHLDTSFGFSQKNITVLSKRSMTRKSCSWVPKPLLNKTQGEKQVRNWSNIPGPFYKPLDTTLDNSPKNITVLSKRSMAKQIPEWIKKRRDLIVFEKTFCPPSACAKKKKDAPAKAKPKPAPPKVPKIKCKVPSGRGTGRTAANKTCQANLVDTCKPQPVCACPPIPEPDCCRPKPKPKTCCKPCNRRPTCPKPKPKSVCKLDRCEKPDCSKYQKKSKPKKCTFCTSRNPRGSRRLSSMSNTTEDQSYLNAGKSIFYEPNMLHGLKHSLNESRMCNNFLDLSEIFKNKYITYHEAPYIKEIQMEDEEHADNFFPEEMDEKVKLLDSDLKMDSKPEENDFQVFDEEVQLHALDPRRELLKKIHKDSKLDKMSANLIKDFKEKNLSALELSSQSIPEYNGRSVLMDKFESEILNKYYKKIKTPMEVPEINSKRNIVQEQKFQGLEKIREPEKSVDKKDLHEEIDRYVISRQQFIDSIGASNPQENSGSGFGSGSTNVPVIVGKKPNPFDEIRRKKAKYFMKKLKIIEKELKKKSVISGSSGTSTIKKPDTSSIQVFPKIPDRENLKICPVSNGIQSELALNEEQKLKEKITLLKIKYLVAQKEMRIQQEHQKIDEKIMKMSLQDQEKSTSNSGEIARTCFKANLPTLDEEEKIPKQQEMKTENGKIEFSKPRHGLRLRRRGLRRGFRRHFHKISGITGFLEIGKLRKDLVSHLLAKYHTQYRFLKKGKWIQPRGKEVFCRIPKLPNDDARTCGEWKPPKPKKLDFTNRSQMRTCQDMHIVDRFGKKLKEHPIPTLVKDYHQTLCRKKKFCPCHNEKEEKLKNDSCSTKSPHVIANCAVKGYPGLKQQNKEKFMDQLEEKVKASGAAFAALPFSGTCSFQGKPTFLVIRDMMQRMSKDSCRKPAPTCSCCEEHTDPCGNPCTPCCDPCGNPCKK